MKYTISILVFITICFDISISKTPVAEKLSDQKLENCKGVVEWIKTPDSETGYEVWQITNHDSASVACYFERQGFTADDKYIVFGSKRTGQWKLYRADLATGEIVEIPFSDVNNPFAFTIHPDGKNLCYMRDGILYKTDVAKLEVDTLLNCKDKFQVTPEFSSSFTSDGKYTLIRTRSDTAQSIYRVNLLTGDIEHALTWKQGRLSHPLICPTSPDLITFVPGPDTQNDMTLPMEKRARTWIVNMKTGEVRQFLTVPYGFRATHESWSADGRRFFFFRKTQPDWLPVSICSINQKGEDRKEYYTHETIRLGHGVSSADGRWFIIDGQDPGHNPLMLLELATGKAITLCWPNSSIDSQHLHVHPSFSSSGRFVCYTSDRTGTPQVYVVPIERVF